MSDAPADWRAELALLFAPVPGLKASRFAVKSPVPSFATIQGLRDQLFAVDRGLSAEGNAGASTLRARPALTRRRRQDARADAQGRRGPDRGPSGGRASPRRIARFLVSKVCSTDVG